MSFGLRERMDKNAPRHWTAVVLVLLSSICPIQVQTTWWALSQVQTLSLVDSGAICDLIPGLVGRQRTMCRSQPDVMVSVVRGAQVGVRECQRQFSDERWNCSTSDRDASVFGKVMLKVGSREAAFVYAISSAGVVHAITRACSRGLLIDCACDPSKRGQHHDKKGPFDWGGCSDNVKYGSTFARKFIDAKEKRVRDARALMNLHNNRAGRRAVKKYMKLLCKCHGVSGSCVVRTCWKAMQGFRDVGNHLRTKYNGATKVTIDQSGTGLELANRRHKRKSKNDLVYFEDSPDYCLRDEFTGSLGTAGRECNRTSLGTEGCNILCCGRGYDTKTVLKITKCECKFHWCCDVKCKECREYVDVHTCKGPNPTPPPSEGKRRRRYR